MGEDGNYRPRMSARRVRRLREWHDQAMAGDARAESRTVAYRSLTLIVPPDVYPPNPNGLADLVADEVKPTDTVLDMGTGSGINGLVAATKSRSVLGVDINPAAVEAANANAARNGLADRFQAIESDVFSNVNGRFDLIVFDPPFRWFVAHDMRERATADENYASLRAFVGDVSEHLTARGRILLAFGTTGDLAYLQELISGAGLRSTTIREVQHRRKGWRASYFAYRLTRHRSG